MRKEKWQVFIIGGLCFLTAASICVQYRSAQSYITKSDVSVQSMSENKLRDNVLKEQENNKKLSRELQSKLDELENLRKTTASNSEEAQALETQLTELNRLLGYTDVTGKGLVITLQDADASSNGYTNDNLVHDLDLVDIVNELFNAGAEAVSINDQRITTSTAINCNGNVVRINNEKVSVPFVIKAIGSPEGLYGTMTRPGGYLSLMENGKIKIKVEKKEELTVSKFNGTHQYKYMEIAE